MLSNVHLLQMQSMISAFDLNHLMVVIAMTPTMDLVIYGVTSVTFAGVLPNHKRCSRMCIGSVLWRLRQFWPQPLWQRMHRYACQRHPKLWRLWRYMRQL